MFGTHVLIDQLPVLENAFTNVTVEAAIFAESIVDKFLVSLLVSPQSRWATESCLAVFALVRLFSRVQICVICHVTFSFERHVAYFTDMLRTVRMNQHVLLEINEQMTTLGALPLNDFAVPVVLMFERLLNFSRNPFDRGIHRFRFVRQARSSYHGLGLKLSTIFDRVSPEFVIIHQAAHGDMLRALILGGNQILLELFMLTELRPVQPVVLPVRSLATLDELMANDDLRTAQLANQGRDSLDAVNLYDRAVVDLLR